MKFVLNDEVANRHNITFGDLCLGDIFMRDNKIYIKTVLKSNKTGDFQKHNAIKLSDPLASLVYFREDDTVAKYIGDNIYLDKERFIDTEVD